MLELAVVVAAALLPLELSLFTPQLRATYADGAGALFPVVRVVICLVMVFVPAVALGATFPMAIRWFAAGSERPTKESITLYFSTRWAHPARCWPVRPDPRHRHQRHDLRDHGRDGDCRALRPGSFAVAASRK